MILRDAHQSEERNSQPLGHLSRSVNFRCRDQPLPIELLAEPSETPEEWPRLGLKKHHALPCRDRPDECIGAGEQRRVGGGLHEKITPVGLRKGSYHGPLLALSFCTPWRLDRCGHCWNPSPHLWIIWYASPALGSPMKIAAPSFPLVAYRLDAKTETT